MKIVDYKVCLNDNEDHEEHEYEFNWAPGTWTRYTCPGVDNG